MDQVKIKQQVIEKIKSASKILVTVSDSPSVDALSAALGLTLLLDKQEKYATAIFSGETPPAIAFLEPEKTFDDTTDSLRDFIIALNKEKADHLRYKVEGESVKIFITPYRTVIDESDLEFSQGDYNVELVIALGVDSQENLDSALDNHGQILHDADIITITSGVQRSDLGGIDWYDANASSLSEMVAGLVDSFKDAKSKKTPLDAPIATALLTGIVAETERFSNERTTSGAMTVAAKLMAAGADQQLIANELQQVQDELEEAPEPEIETPEEDIAPAVEGDATEESDTPEDEGEADSTVDSDGGLTINHSNETLADLDKRVRGHEASKRKVDEEKEALENELEADALSEAVPKVEQYVKSSQKATAYDAPESEAPSNVTSVATAAEEGTPTLGGTLNATTEQAADDKRREEANDRNRTILAHSYLPGEGDPNTAVSATADAEPSDPSGGLFSTGPASPAYAPSDPVMAAPEDALMSGQTNGQLFAASGERVIQPLSETAAAIAEPAVNPVASADFDLPLPPPLPDFSQVGASGLPPMPPAQPEILGDILAPEAPAPQPSAAPAYGIDPSAFSAQPAPAQMPAPEIPVSSEPATAYAPTMPAPSATPADPGQFQIPAQQ